MGDSPDYAQALYVRLCHHLDQVDKHPETTTLDARLLDEAANVLPERLALGSLTNNDVKGRGEELITLLAMGLNKYQDPAPAAFLLTRLFGPWSWSEVCEFGKTFPIPYTECLAPGEYMVPFNTLILSLMEKATTSAVNAAEAAVMLDNIRQLVRCWLCTPDAAVASRSSALLLSLLSIDQEVKISVDDKLPTGRGQGLVWKRIFGDRGVYEDLFELCSEKSHLSKAMRTIAQGRLLDFIPSVAQKDWARIAQSQNSEIEQKYGVNGGLLDYAALKMVDYKDDPLMHITLIDFYRELLANTKTDQVAGGHGASVGLQYLVAHGIHDRIITLYLQPPGTEVDPLDSMLLRGPSARYVSEYIKGYRRHFLASQTAEQVRQCLLQKLSLTASQWSRPETDTPHIDLIVLTSLPRSMLLPKSNNLDAWRSSLLSLIPSECPNPTALKVLGSLFSGPQRPEISFPGGDPLHNTDLAAEYEEERANARALYFHYLANTELFWARLIRHANILALGDVALASIETCMNVIVTANWPDASSSTEPSYPLPTTIPTPESGSLAFISPGALQFTMPYIMENAPQSGPVGSHGNGENITFQVKTAKINLMKDLEARMAEDVKHSSEPEALEKIRQTIRNVLARGPAASAQAAPVVATLNL